MEKKFEKMLRGFDVAALVAVGLMALTSGCSGEDYAAESEENEAVESEMATELELGQAEQAWGWFDSSSLASSCSDPTGTDSVLAALAVATATELRRWQPTLDFYVTQGTLQLTATGKARCAGGKCFNTQAILDMQKSAASIEVRPGVKVSPSILRWRLTYNHAAQAKCTTSWWSSCRAPDHEFRFLHSEPGSCDTNYWFEALSPQGTPLASLTALKEKLIWVDIDDNSYIKFQSSGATVAIDPTYGLNEVGSSAAGSCTAACTKISSNDVSGQCCSCNGTRSYKRSAFNTSVYLCN